MNLIINNMKWIILVSGVLTCTMLYAVISPQAALLTTFGETLAGPLADMVVRSWGALIVLMGIMLIYAAYKPMYRQLVLTVAGISKLFFISLILAYGYGQHAMLTVLFDGFMVLIYFSYLITVRGGESDKS
ncbi:MAG: hypothetical protein OEX12_04805 [Gammaproteobacteria bacterium]|nr:hypothetical protein [Gammaproteobacteria bacterium]